MKFLRSCKFLDSERYCTVLSSRKAVVQKTDDLVFYAREKHENFSKTLTQDFYSEIMTILKLLSKIVSNFNDKKIDFIVLKTLFHTIYYILYETTSLLDGVGLNRTIPINFGYRFYSEKQ